METYIVLRDAQRTPLGDPFGTGTRGLTPPEVVDRLGAKRIIVTATPYSPSYARVSPSIVNTPGEIDKALTAIRSLR